VQCINIVFCIWVGFTGHTCENAVLCPSNCSGRGSCADSVCQCDSQYTGLSCESLVSLHFQTPTRMGTMKSWHYTLHKLQNTRLHSVVVPFYHVVYPQKSRGNEQITGIARSSIVMLTDILANHTAASVHYYIN